MSIPDVFADGSRELFWHRLRGFNSGITASETGANWQLAMMLMGCMPCMRLTSSVIRCFDCNPPVMTRFQPQYGTIGTWESKWESTENLSSKMPFGIPCETLGDSWLCYPMNPKNFCRGAVGHPLSIVDPCWSSFLFCSDVFMIFITILIYLFIYIYIYCLDPCFPSTGIFLSTAPRSDRSNQCLWSGQSVAICCWTSWLNEISRPGDLEMSRSGLASDDSSDSHFRMISESGHFPSDFFGWLSRCVEMCALSESLNFEAGTKLKHLQQCSGRLRDTQLVSASHPLAWCDSVISKKPQRTFQESGYRFRCRSSQILMFALHWWKGKLADGSWLPKPWT